ncbi:MAG: hypothetical protein ACI9TH_001544 [Kiritimatiellia bacterium]|jgi:hypothetical protein
MKRPTLLVVLFACTASLYAAPEATPVDAARLNVERLYSVPLEERGSGVAMTVPDVTDVRPSPVSMMPACRPARHAE